jgi:hypothetical protein
VEARPRARRRAVLRAFRSGSGIRDEGFVPALALWHPGTLGTVAPLALCRLAPLAPWHFGTLGTVSSGTLALWHPWHPGTLAILSLCWNPYGHRPLNASRAPG